MTNAIIPLCSESYLGWASNSSNQLNVAGTYLHGIFDNGTWRRSWLNQLRKRKGLSKLSENEPNYLQKKENLLDLLADAFEKHIDISPLLGK